MSSVLLPLRLTIEKVITLKSLIYFYLRVFNHMNTTHKAATFRVKEINNNCRISFSLSHIDVNLQGKENGSLEGFEFTWVLSLGL